VYFNLASNILTTNPGIVFYPRYYEWIDACGHLFFESIGLNIGKLGALTEPSLA